MNSGKFTLLQQEFPEWELHPLPGGMIGAIPLKMADWSVLGRRIAELSGKPAKTRRRKLRL